MLTGAGVRCSTASAAARPHVCPHAAALQLGLAQKYFLTRHALLRLNNRLDMPYLVAIGLRTTVSCWRQRIAMITSAHPLQPM